ncbi:CAP-Gly domain-containing linker protein 1-like [Pollicipes pollicipes]|uniref:CAP-Gly domain-containing linker protein 1-like n=1 Tax=Pollicipes pollicipes TaxID=41117 RepID=UPI00188590D9|nr:CAP-Gly domain-containing linker protein 1-like [Pollicipes pollicipes]
MDSARKMSGVKPPSRLARPTAGLARQNGDPQHFSCGHPGAEAPKKPSDTPRRPSDVSRRPSDAPRKPSDATVLTADTSSFRVGDRVWVSGTKPGQIMYIGETQFAPGEWAGVVLDTPDGKNNGSVAGVRYFMCEQNRGIFSRLTKLSRTPLGSTGAEADAVADGRSVPSSRRSSIAMGTRATNASMVTSPMDSSMISSPGEDLELGDKVIVSSSSGSKTGLLRYLGKTEFAEGQWAGVELETPSGKNDGTVAGKRYFSCRPNYGLFAPAHKISRPARRSSQKMGVHALRRSTSRESLQSVASQASRVSAQVLKEKEEHIEQLLRERDMERSEVVRAASLVDDGEVKVLAAKREQLALSSRTEQGLHEEAALLRNELAEQRRQLEQQSAAGDSRSEERERADEVRTLAKERDEVRLEAARAAADINENMQRIMLLEGEASRVRHEADDELASLRAQLKKRADEQRALAAAQAAERRADQLQTQLDTWRRDGELLKERVTALKDFADAASRRSLQRLRQEVELLKQERDSREEDAAVVRQEQGKELERLKKELSSKEGDSAAARQEQQEELEKLKLELESVTQDATAIQQQQKRKLERLTEELASKEADGAASRQKLEKELERLEQELASKKQDSAAAGQEQKQELERLKQKLNSTERENAAFRREQEAKLEQLHEELDSRDRDVAAVRLEQREELERQQQKLDDARREAETSRRLLLEAQQRARPAPAVPLTNGAADAAGHVDFLNSVIADLQGRNDELTRQVRLLAVGDEDEEEEAASPAAPARPPPRLWCDICEEFDRHDTDECPTQASTPEEPPPSRHGGARGVRRQFCMACEMFGHTADQCDAGETF